MDFSKLKKILGSNTSPKARFWQIFSVIAVVSVIVLVLIGVHLFRWTTEAIVHNKPEARMPDITGKSSLYALETLSKMRLSMRIEGYENKTDMPHGAILKQIPAAEGKIREGQTVTVIVSQGGESVFTPTLIGMSLRNATMLLKQNNLKLGDKTTGYSLKIPKGTVLDQNPEPEKIVDKNTKVNVRVSEGKPPESIQMMPDFMHQNRETVRLWAQSIDIKVEFIEDTKSDMDRGTVIEQSPKPDTVLDGNTEIKITVSGKEGKEIPQENNFSIKYNVPSSGTQRTIKIVSIGKEGEKEVFNGIREPGSQVNISISKEDITKVRIFVNGIQVEERPVK